METKPLKHVGVLPVLAALTVAALLAGCAGEPPVDDPSVDTLAEGSWPTEALSSEAGSTKKLLLSSIEAGGLSAEAAAEAFADDFRGEDFHQRPASGTRIESGIHLADWQETEATLDAGAFRERWNAWLAALGEVQTVEIHTWEIQLRPQAGGLPGIETREAVWILARLEDGRLREERLYLVLDLVKLAGGGWKIAGVGSDEGRTTTAPGPFFRDVSAQVLPPGYDQIGAQIYTDGGPVLADFDADGDVDLFLPRIHAAARLYENDGTGHFEDVTAARGLELNALRQGSNSGLFLDLDRDGRLDLAVGSKQSGLLLFRNEGKDGGSVRSSDAPGDQPLGGAGEWESLAAADYDGDGLVDLYLTNYNLIDAEHQPASYVDARDGLGNVLLRNTGDFRFEDATAAAGLDANAERWSYAAAWADYDRDGDVDLFVANDYGPNSLYRNRGNGRHPEGGQTEQFEQVATEVGAEDYGNGMGVLWADVDGDLWLDAYVSNMQSFAGNRITRLEDFPGSAEDRALYRRFSKGNTLLRNLGDSADGDVAFEDVTDQAGVRGAFWAWGNLAFDYDSDADLDLFVCGGFYTGASAKDT